MIEFSINSTYNFETLAPAILGDKIKNAKLTSIVDYGMATKLFNPNSQHANVYTHLPPGTPRDLTKYVYYVFKTENNETRVFAREWINLNSAELVSGTTIRVDIYNISAQDQAHIRQLLLAAGYTSLNFQVIS